MIEGRNFGNEVEINRGASGSDIHLAAYTGESGIIKTVTTQVVTENDKERSSTNSWGQEYENPRDIY